MIKDRDKCRAHVIDICKFNNPPDNDYVILKRARGITNTIIIRISTPRVCWASLSLYCNHVRYMWIKVKY